MELEEYQSLHQLAASHWWLRGKRAIAASLIDGAVGGARGLRVLDVGCGPGGNVRFLARYGEVVGVDISPLALDFCRRDGLRRLGRATANSLPFADESFDLVTCFEVLYHRAVDDDAAFAELTRVCRRGGHIFIIEPAYHFMFSEHDIVWRTGRRYTATALRRLARNNGLRVRRVSYANNLLFPAVLAVRLARRVLRTRTGQQSNLWPVPAPLNGLLLCICRLEGWLMRRMELPFGSSIVLLAQRPA